MSTYGRFTAAIGSILLNVMVAVVLTQAAGAAIPATGAPVPNSRPHAVYVSADRHAANAHCTSGIRTRAIIAVVLALIV